MTDRVQFQILGPLRATGRSRAVRLGGPRTRLVLAVLLLENDRVIPAERLVEAVWGGSPPASARAQIAIAVSHLRRAFRAAGNADQVIETVRPGYRLRAEAIELDAATVDGEVAQARAAAQRGRLDEAAAMFRTALARWDGPVLAGLDSAIISAGGLRWEELRLTVAEELAELELARGRHHEVAGDLMTLVAEHPLRERLRAELMTALYRSGRQAESLEVYQQGRRILADELGLEPGRGLRELHEAILQDDPSVKPMPASAPCPGTSANLPGTARYRRGQQGAGPRRTFRPKR